MADDLVPLPPPGRFLIFADGGQRLRVRLDRDTVWLPQRQIAELFQVTVPTVNEHLSGIYDDGELDPGATIRKFRIVQTEGARQVATPAPEELDAAVAQVQRLEAEFPPQPAKKPGRKKKGGEG